MSEDKLTIQQREERGKFNVYKAGKGYKNLDRYIELNFDRMSFTDMAKAVGVGRSTINSTAKRLGLSKYEFFTNLRCDEQIVNLDKYGAPWDTYMFTSHGRLINKDTKQVMRPKNTQGYQRYEFKAGGKYVGKFQHVLLAENFIPNPDNKPYVNHIDGIKSNNSLVNLEWVTHKENMNHAQQVLMKAGMFGETSNLAKLTEEQAIELIEEINLGGSYSEIKERLPYVTTSMIKNMKFNGTWGHLDHLKKWDKSTFKESKRSLSVQDVQVIRYLHKCKNVTGAEISRLFDENPKKISEVLTRKTYADIEDL